MADERGLTRRAALLAGSAAGAAGLAGCTVNGVELRPSVDRVDGEIERASEATGDAQSPGTPTPVRADAGPYLQTKAAYRHVVARPLPADPDGALDIEQVVVDAALADPYLPPGVGRRVAEVVDALRAGDRDGAVARWQDALEASRSAGLPLDLNALLQYVLRQAYLESAADLKHYASKVAYFNEKKRALRAWLREARALRERLPADCDNDPAICDLEADLAATIDSFEAELETSCEGDDQLANIDLQTAMQSQQQTLQTMSAVAKALHDASMNVVRNLR